MGFESIAFAVIGFFAGLAGGMLGIGGSTVLIPALTEFLGPDQHLYQAAAMIVSFFVTIPAVWEHGKAKAIDGSLVIALIPLALVGIAVGVGISELGVFAGDGEAYLRGLFGLCLLALCGFDLLRRLRPQRMSTSEPRPAPLDDAGRQGQGSGLPPSHEPTAPPVMGERVALPGYVRPGRTWPLLAAVALPTGLVAGLLGVGGGTLAVPLQQRLLRVPLRSAIANSAVLIIATTPLGAAIKNYAYYAEHRSFQALMLAAILIPSAMLGGLLGGRLTHRLPLRAVRATFFVFLLVAALRMIYGAGRSL